MPVHDPVVSREKVKIASPRSFGLVFAGVFALLGLLGWYRTAIPPVRTFIVAAVFLAVTLAAPRLLTPLNQLWFRIGLGLHVVTTPVIMGLLYFCGVVPTGILMRLFGKDPLRLRRDPDAQSYWIVRNPPGPPPGSMSKQF
jgi:hypothetical protein